MAECERTCRRQCCDAPTVTVGNFEVDSINASAQHRTVYWIPSFFRLTTCCVSLLAVYQDV